MSLTFFGDILLATLLALFAAPLGIFLARRWGMIDQPGSAPYKTHTRPMPLAGGLVIFPVLVLSAWLLGGFANQDVRVSMLGAAVIFLFGIWDDRRGLSPLWKLFGQLLATTLLIAGGVLVRFPGLPALNYLVTILWVVGLTNAFNLVDSMDGLALGLAGIAAAFFMLGAQAAGQVILVRFSAVLVGACVGLFYFNVSPARLFLGDSGSQLLGFLLAALAIAYTPLNLPQASTWFVPILLLGVPIFDTSLVTVSRLRRGAVVLKGHRDHTYHRLVSLGVSPVRAVLTMHMGAALLGCLAIVAQGLPPVWANLILGLCLLLGLLALIYLERKGLLGQDAGV
jgi:UDP-GlcNAc:undecaprenyl-phosphate GlcNAc-1-phosphate transferase